MLCKQEHFCHFLVLKSTTHHDYTNSQPLGFLSPRIAYISKGSCTMYTPDGFNLTLNQGDVWYLPKNQPYNSVWKANGYVEFYCFEFEMDFFSNDYTLFEKIENSNLKESFINLYNYFENEEKLLALKEFYSIVSEITPKLTKKENKNLDAIMPALNYLHANYIKPIKVRTLADLCFLSESRFYSLFKRLMKQSPINYKNNVKTSKAIELLQNGYTLEKICEQLDYSSPAFLRSMMKKYTGLSPKLLKKGSPL